MTKSEIYALSLALENCINREKELAKSFIELNPSDADRRKRDASLVILGMQEMYYEIKRQIHLD